MIHKIKTTNTKKDNHNKTKTNYQKTIFKTKKRSLRIGHKNNTGTLRIKRFHKQNNPINNQKCFLTPNQKPQHHHQ